MELGGIFIHLNPIASVAEGSITKSQLDEALQEEINPSYQVSDYNPTGVTYHAGSSIVKVGTVMYQCRRGTTSSTFDNRTPGTSTGKNYWDTLLAVRDSGTATPAPASTASCLCSVHSMGIRTSEKLVTRNAHVGQVGDRESARPGKLHTF